MGGRRVDGAAGRCDARQNEPFRPCFWFWWSIFRQKWSFSGCSRGAWALFVEIAIELTPGGIGFLKVTLLFPSTAVVEFFG